MLKEIPMPTTIDYSLFEEKSDKLQVKYGLPTEVKYCKNCVIFNQRPSSTNVFSHTAESKKTTISFDDNDICRACKFAIEKLDKQDWNTREQELDVSPAVEPLNII